LLKERDAIIRRFLQMMDAMVIVIAFITAYYIRKYFHLFYPFDLFPGIQVVKPSVAPIGQYTSFLIIAVPVWLLALRVFGIYKSIRTRNLLSITLDMIKAAAFAMLISGTLTFLLKIEYISRLLFAIFVLVNFFLLMAEKWLFVLSVGYIRKRGYNYRQLLIVGTGDRAQNFIGMVEKHPEWGFRIAGLVSDDKKDIGRSLSEYEIIGALEDIQDILHKRAIDEVIFLIPRAWLDKVQQSIAICELEGVKTSFALDFFDLKIAHSVQTELEGIPFISFETTLGREEQLFIKRMTDIAFSAAAIILLFPVFLIAAILIKLTSEGPALFKQKRLGRNGRRFTLYKFRSMYHDAQERFTELERLNESSGPVFKIKNDPRITPLGRVLRRFSVDELSQLFNVLMGHMSIVGPRPPLPDEVKEYEPWQRRRLSMRPGLTCLWQVNGRNKIKFDEWMKLDLQYIDNWSLWLDFKIFLKTIPVVVLGIGAQ